MNARFFVVLTLVVAGVVMRVVPHPWNFAPIGAIALFGGAHFERRALGLAVPLITMFLGDVLIGFHSLMPVLYATYAVIALIGMRLRDRRTSIAAVGTGVVASSVLFFLVSNFAVWTISTLYAKTAAGLLTCYVAGLPFFGNTLASDALYTLLLFGAFAAAERTFPRLSAVTP